MLCLLPSHSPSYGARKSLWLSTEALALPPEVVIAERLDEIDPEAVHAVRLAMRRFLAERLQAELRRCYESLAPIGPYRPDAASSGRRALRNLCLAYLVDLGDEPSRRMCLAQLSAAANATNKPITARLNMETSQARRP